MSVSYLGARPVLGSRDLERSKVFWSRLLRFEVAVERPEHLVLRAGATEIQLDHTPDPAVGHVVIEVHGVEELHDRCVAAGATILATLHFHDSARRDFSVRDPDGHRVRFVEQPRFGARVAGVELPVAHPAASVAFWRAVVGFDDEPKTSSRDGFKAVSLGTDGRTVATVTEFAEVPVVWLVKFAVDSMEEALAEVEAHGGKIWMRGARESVVQDPNGAIAALVVG